MDSADWETGGRATRVGRMAKPAALVVAGLLVGAVLIPRGGEQPVPLAVDETESTPEATPPPPDPSAAGRWTPMPAGPLAPRHDPVSAWTGNALLVWGGRAPQAPEWLADGAAFDPTRERWRPLPASPLEARADVASGWTGAELLIWGGAGGAEEARPTDGGSYDQRRGTGGEAATEVLGDGAAYDPGSRRWRRMATAPLSPRRGAKGVWTGDRFVVWGGFGPDNATHLTDGASYDPRTDRWTPMRPGPLSGHRLIDVQAAASRGRVLFWASSHDQALVAVYDPGQDRWQSLSAPRIAPGTAPALAEVAGAITIWGRAEAPEGLGIAARLTAGTGLWGTTRQPPRAPRPGQALVAAGARGVSWDRGSGTVFDTITGRWQTMPPAPLAPEGSALQAWTGQRLLVWDSGGLPGDPRRGATFVPASSWRPLTAAPAPIDEEGVAVWTGWLRGEQEALFWGGLRDGFEETGSAYDPELRLWERMTPSPLPRRVDPAAVWTGAELMILGGRDQRGAPPLHDAAAYDPSTNRWRALPDLPMAVAGNAAARSPYEVYVVGKRDNRVAMVEYDAHRNEWRRLPAPPIEGAAETIHAVWSEFEVWVWTMRSDGTGEGAAWDPLLRGWRRLPDLQGMDMPVGVTWAGNRLFLVDARGKTVGLGRGGVEWYGYPRSPVHTGSGGEDSEAPAVGWNSKVLLAYDPQEGRLATLDPSAAAWTPFPNPRLPRSAAARLLWTGRDLFALAGGKAAILTR